MRVVVTLDGNSGPTRGVSASGVCGRQRLKNRVDRVSGFAPHLVVSRILNRVRNEYGAASQFRHAERVSLDLGRVYEFR